MTPDYRALCAELLAAIQLYTQLNPAASDMSASELTEKLMDAMAATVAALAQPVPERPTDEEIARFLADRYRARMDNQSAFGCPDFDGSKAKAAQIADARAVLARWGRPTPQPVAVSERLPSAADCDVEDNCWWFDPHADGAWYVDTFQSCYTHWLPSSALPLPVDS
jgi:hypothetical protein